MEDVYTRRRGRERRGDIETKRIYVDTLFQQAGRLHLVLSFLLPFLLIPFSFFSTSSCVVALCVGISSPTHSRIQSAGKRAASSSFSFLRSSASRITRAGYIACQSRPAYVFMISVRSENGGTHFSHPFAYTRKLLLSLSL